jgi:glycosyltransferase involved in cell wall biosynthesis
MSDDRLAWKDTARRAALLDHLLRVEADVYHFHHYWRVGADLISALRRARPAARLVMTFHEMLAICLHHGQMIRTGDGALCEQASPGRCLTCFPRETAERLTIRKALLLDALRGLDAAIFPSAFLRARYEAWGLAVPRSIVLENPLSPEMLAAPRGGDSVPGIEARFAFFGQATPFKGVDVLLPAFAAALAGRPDLRLTVHGFTAETAVAMFPGLAEPLQALGGAVTFAGAYRPSEVLGLMRRAGWVVVPSIWWENSPMIIQEAMRAGTPLVVADIGGMAEKVRPGLDGLHFRCASVPDLTRALLEAADGPRRARIAASLADAPGIAAFLAGLGEAYGLETPWAGAPER